MIEDNELEAMGREELIRMVRQLSFDKSLLQEDVKNMQRDHQQTFYHLRMKLDEYEELTDMLTEQVDELGKELLAEIGKRLNREENGI